MPLIVDINLFFPYPYSSCLALTRTQEMKEYASDYSGKKWNEGKDAMNARELWWLCNKKIKSREDVNKQDSKTYGLNKTKKGF